MTQLVSRQVALAKIETTYNTDSTPTAGSNAFLVTNLQVEQQIKMNARNVIKQSLAPLQSVAGPSMATLSFDVEMKGSGAAGTAPEYDALLQACGLHPTIVASTSVTYKPVSTGYKSATIYIYQDGSLFKFTGCLGTYTIDVKSGGIPTYKFKFSGNVESHTDTSLPSATYSTIVPPAALDVAVQVGSYTPIMSAFTFNSGNKVETPESIAAVNGYADFIISARDGKGTLNVEATLIGNFDYYGAFQAGTNYTYSMPIGATAGNIITISHPGFYIEDIKQANASGILTYNISYGALETTPGSDDEISIVYT